MEQEQKISESSIRFEARLIWREEARLDGYTKYPLNSLERAIYLDEAHKIRFADEMSV